MVLHFIAQIVPTIAPIASQINIIINEVISRMGGYSQEEKAQHNAHSQPSKRTIYHVYS